MNRDRLDVQRLPVSRRAFMLASGALVTPTLLPWAVMAQGRPLNFLTWGGRFGQGVRKAFSDPFTAKSGVVINDITPYNYGRFVTALQNRNPENFDLAWFPTR